MLGTTKTVDLGPWYTSMSKHVMYKGVALMQGSEAYELWYNTVGATDSFHMKKFVAHMKQLDQNEKDLLQRYDKITKVETPVPNSD